MPFRKNHKYDFFVFHEPYWCVVSGCSWHWMILNSVHKWNLFFLHEWCTCAFWEFHFWRMTCHTSHKCNFLVLYEPCLYEFLTLVDLHIFYHNLHIWHLEYIFHIYDLHVELWHDNEEFCEWQIFWKINKYVNKYVVCKQFKM